MPSLLEIENLRTHIRLKTSTVQAVDGVSLTVAAGETVGLVGESGCGKTMTGMSIMRLLPPGGHIVGGQVRLEGRDLVQLSDDEMRHVRGNDVAVIFQDPMTSLNPTMTIGRQISESVMVHKGADRRQARDRALEVLRLVGMPHPDERIDYFPHQLSGGLRQRVMIAMALACDPKLLIADEPTTALDVTIQAQILALLDRLKAELGMGMLLITHDMGVIAGRADRVMVMYAGRIVEAAETVELFGEMRHPYTEALLESIPQLDEDRSTALYSIPGLPPDLTHPPSFCRFAPRCRYAQDRCRAEDPPLGGEDPEVHPYACFFPVHQKPAEERIGAHLQEIEHGLAVDSATATDRAGKQAQPSAAHRPDEASDETPTEVDEGVPVTAQPATARINPALPVSASPLSAQSTDAAAGRTGAAVTADRDALHAVTAAAQSGAADAPLLVLEHVVKEFPVTSGSVMQRKIGTIKAVSDVSFTVFRGETFGLVGESGCGKTTIGRMVVALDSIDSGSITFAGEDISKLRGKALRQRRRHMQMIFQDPYASLDPRMRVGPTLREPMTIQGMYTREERARRVAELLGEVGLRASAQDLYPHEFSGGQRQRLGFARALTLDPRLIVADEPVSALDVSIQSQVLNLMRRLQGSHDLTYIVISHDLSVVRYLADRVGVMYLGKMVEIGGSSQVYDAPAHPYTAGLLQAIPVPDPTRERVKAREVMRGELPSAMNPPSGCRFRTRCPRAEDLCAEVEPVLRAFGEPTHLAACHFPLQPPLGEEPAKAATVGA